MKKSWANVLAGDSGSGGAQSPRATGGAGVVGVGGGEMVVKEQINLSLVVIGKAEVDRTKIRPLRPRTTQPSAFKTYQVVANHFPVVFDMKAFPAKVYHYDVVIAPKEAQEVKGAPPVLVESTVPDRLLHGIWWEFEKRFHKRLGSRMPFDGRKNCYTVKPLNLGGNAVWSDELVMPDPDDDDKIRRFRIQLKFASEVSTSIMWTYLRSSKSLERVELPQEVIQALDVALRYSPAINYTPCTRSFYSDQKPHTISSLLELWFGHNQSLLLGRDERATLNMDMANKAFTKKMRLTNLIGLIMGKKEVDLEQKTWTAADYKNGNDFLRGKLLQYGTGPRNGKGEYERKHRFVCVEIVRNYDATNYEFNLDGKTTTIVQYFHESKGITLEHPHWPVVHVGNKNMTNYVPLELLEILQQPYKGKLEPRDTSEMIKGSAKPPIDRFQRIKVSRDRSLFEQCPILKEFGMQVQREMITIPDAKKIPLPVMTYRDAAGNKRNYTPRGPDGKFMIGKFLEPARLPRISVVNASGNLSSNFTSQIRIFLNKMGEEANALGLVSGVPRMSVQKIFQTAEIREVKARPIRAASIEDLNSKIRTELNSVKEANARNGETGGLVIAILGKDGNEYPMMKFEAEVKVGILTQCVKIGTVDKVVGDRGAKQVLINILLKVNAKLNGVSFSLSPDILHKDFKFLEEPMLILGADVTHPAPNSKTPSIAAITASCDKNGMCYQMHIQTQENPKKANNKSTGPDQQRSPNSNEPEGGKPKEKSEQAQEVITGLNVIVKSMIIQYRNKNNIWPKRIIMFRDGVSEGQFAEIKASEFQNGIQSACEEIRRDNSNFNPKLTFLVVKKRHHTRFRPVDIRDSVKPKDNILPGTVVDTVITHPTEMEFFLNSHVGIQGTSKPTRYHVIHDDCNFTMDQLEKLTYYLCYTFVRCTQPVSYPAPTYYAHLAAFRARALIESDKEKEKDNGNSNSATETPKPKNMVIHEDLRNKYPMFFV